MTNIAMSPVPVMLGDVEYRLSPLTDRDWGALDLWVRAKFFESARELAGEPGTAQYDAVIRITLQEAAGITWSRWPGTRIATSDEGVARLALQSVLKLHPRAALDDMGIVARDKEVFARFKQAFDLVNDLGGTAKHKEQPSSGTPLALPSST